MSIERCIAALRILHDDLSRVGAGATGELFGQLLRDLTLDVDLRRDAPTRKLMSDVELDFYLPVIEQVLSLLRQIKTGLPLAHVELVNEALDLTQIALNKASQRAA
jgi:hypothetical protein